MKAKILFVLAWTVFAVLSCSKPSVGGDNNGNVVGPQKPSGEDNKPYFKADLPDEFIVNRDPGSVSWSVDTNIEDWTVTSSEDWCVAEVTEDSRLLLTIEDYDPRTDNGIYIYDPPRTCSIEVKAGDTFSKKFKLVQQCRISISFPYLTSAIKLPPSGGSVDVIVSTNAYKWAAQTDASWIEVRCVDNTTLRIKSTARSGQETEIRQATIKVYPTSDETQYSTLSVQDTPPTVDGDDWDYGDHTDWD